MEILRLVACGMDNKAIAHNLNITTNTVGTHLKDLRSRIYPFINIGVGEKMSRSQLVIFALQAGVKPMEESGFAIVVGK